MLKNITLQPEQIKVLELPAKGAVQIKGVAGSGKTTVALYRAKYLIENYPSMFEKSNVAIFTYNRVLSNHIEQLASDVEGGYDIHTEKITKQTRRGLPVEVWNFHRWAYHFIKRYANNECEDTIDHKERKNLITEIAASSRIPTIALMSNFLCEEISWIKGKLFNDMQSYVDAPRTGRGNVDKLSRLQKEEVWHIFEQYNDTLKNRNQIDFDDYAIIALNAIKTNRDFEPPYSHIVIDEAQDLNKAQLLVLKELVAKETESITIIADNAQRIYKSGFTWSEVGMEFKGKTRILRKNYRSTIQISKAAQALLTNESSDNDFTQIESARRGESMPVVAHFNSFTKQMEFVLEQINILDHRESIILLTRQKTGVERIAQFLKSECIPFDIINQGEKKTGDNKLKICTLSSIKGLEFDTVFILDCNADQIPSLISAEISNDEFHISTERRLLFTAMTRARNYLYLISSDTPMRFFDEIPENMLERKQ